jgi:hypothetical protein
LVLETILLERGRPEEGVDADCAEVPEVGEVIRVVFRPPDPDANRALGGPLPGAARRTIW